MTPEQLKGSFDRFDEIVREKEGNAQYVARLKKFKLAFGYIQPPPDDPLDQPFAQSVLSRVRNRGIVDRTAAEDQTTGKSFSATRRLELEEVTGGHYLAREYGMRTAMDEALGKSFKEVPGMRVEHPSSSRYLRDEPGKAEDLFKDLYKKKKGPDDGDFDPNTMFFVNSPSVVTKLKNTYGKDLFGPAVADNLTKISDGLYLYTVYDGLLKGGADVKGRIGNVGGMPSSFEAFKNLNSDSPTPALSDKKLLAEKDLGNTGLLESTSRGGAVKRLNSLPADHPLKDNAATAAKLIGGLDKALAKVKNSDAFKKNVLVQNGLKNLASIAEAMPSYVDDSPRFSRLFDVMVDELYLVLATCHPYDGESYSEASTKALKDRAPAIADVKVSSYLFSSGMDSITTGISAALEAARSTTLGGSDAPHYFEVPSMLDGTQTVKKGERVVYSTLNPSLPRTSGTAASAETDRAKDWNVGKLIASIQGSIPETDAQPITVCIDITVEKGADGDGETELNRLFSHFKSQIDSGMISFVLCKSYQKYPSLGTGKVMAGGISVVSKNPTIKDALDGALGKAAGELDFAKTDESQIMTHFIENASGQETALLDRASENAEFAQGFCTGNAGWGRFSKGLPFVHMPKLKADIGGESVSLKGVLASLGLEQRDSFSFQNSSIVPIGEGDDLGIRINTGQESQAEMVEKLYSVGRLVLSKDKISFGDINNLAAGAVDQSLNEAMEKAAPEFWRKPIEAALKADPAVPGELTTKYGTADTSALRPEQLKEYWKVWSKKDGNSGKAFATNMKAVSEAMGPVLETDDRLTKDADYLHASLKYGWKGEGGRVKTAATDAPSDAATYTENIVASCLKLSAAVGPKGGDLDALDAMTEAAMDSGMAHVSNEGRERIVLDWARRASEKLPASLPKLQKYLPLLPYREGSAALLKGIPDDKFGALEKGVQSSLTTSLLGGLDLRTKLVTLEELVWSNKKKAEVCIAQIETVFSDLRKAPRELQSSGTLSTRKPDDDLSPEELKVLLDWFNELKGILVEKPLKEPKDLSLTLKGFLPLRKDWLNPLQSSDLPARYGQGSLQEFIFLLQALENFKAARPADPDWDKKKTNTKEATRIVLKFRRATDAVFSACASLMDSVTKMENEEELTDRFAPPKPALTRKALTDDVTKLKNFADQISKSLTA